MTLSEQLIENIKNKKIALAKIKKEHDKIVVEKELSPEHIIDFNSNGDLEIYSSLRTEGETIERFLNKHFMRMENSRVGCIQLQGVLDHIQDRPNGTLTIGFYDDKENSDGSFFRYEKNQQETKSFVILDISGRYNKIKRQSNGFELQVPHYNIVSSLAIPTAKKMLPIEAVLIQERDDPFHIAIGHEMNHLKHREDGSNTEGNRKKITPAGAIDRVGYKEIWGNAEEHRNVFGLADPGSELNARMEAGLHLRYPYDTDEPFLEPVKTVLRNAVKSERHIEGTTLPPYL